MPLSLPGLVGGGGEVGAPPGLSHAGKNAMLPTKASFEGVGLIRRGGRQLEVGVGMGGALRIVAMPVPWTPRLEIVMLWM